MALSPHGRVSFPEVFKPRAIEEGQKEKFAVTLLFDPANMNAAQKALFKEMHDAANKAAQEKFKCNIGEEYKGKPVASPFRKSNEKPEYYPPGQYFVKFSTLVRPGVVDAAKNPIDEYSNEFYAGCWAHVSYSVFAYDTSGNRGVAFGLRNVQKVKDDESFGGVRSTPDQDFTTLVEENADLDEIAF